MYISFFNEVPKEYYYLNTDKFRDNVYLTSQEEFTDIQEFINKFGFDEYKKLFNIIGIKYSSIEKYGTVYTTPGGNTLQICSLSSGERILLYAFILDALRKPLLIKRDRDNRPPVTYPSDKQNAGAEVEGREEIPPFHLLIFTGH